MKALAGWAVSAGLVLAAGSAHAQALAPDGAGRPAVRMVSDFEEPYGGVPPAPPPYEAPYAPPAYDAPAPRRYDAPPDYGYAPPAYGYPPPLMPPREIYAVLRDNGFLPLGIPHRLGSAYEIAAESPDGENGRLMIDGRTGRIIRFTPGYWGGRPGYSDLRPPYGAQDAMPPPTAVRGVPRPPGLIPHVASRAVPVPAPKPGAAAAAATKPGEPAQRSAAAPQQADRSAPPQVSAAATAPAAEVKPPPQIRPTEPMPEVQGLE